jgi:hypothetical protein
MERTLLIITIVVASAVGCGSVGTELECPNNTKEFLSSSGFDVVLKETNFYEYVLSAGAHIQYMNQEFKLDNGEINPCGTKVDGCSWSLRNSNCENISVLFYRDSKTTMIETIVHESAHILECHKGTKREKEDCANEIKEKFIKNRAEYYKKYFNLLLGQNN